MLSTGEHMFNKLFHDIITFFKTLFAHQTMVTFVARDVVHLVELVAAKKYFDAAVFLLTEVNSVKNINIQDVVNQAKQIGLDVNSFAPVVGKINERLNSLPANKISAALEDTARQSIQLIQTVINTK